MKHSGFSLIELLITLSIIAILTAIIYPSYITHILTTRRAQAKVALIDLATKLEHYHVIHDSYDKATFTELNVRDHTDFYQLEMQITANGYTIYAIPLRQQMQDKCGTLLYNQAGQKHVTGNLAIDDCW